MNITQTTRGRAELIGARNESRKLFWAVFLFSALVNILMLTGPLYMLQVYDRVLGSQSEPTLVALSILMVFLFGMMALLDHARARVAARIGARFTERLDGRVFSAGLRLSAVVPSDPSAQLAQRDLESVQKLLASPVLMALFDMPWTPFFLMAIFLFHPLLGWLAVIGGGALIAMTFINQWMTKEPISKANGATTAAERLGEQIRQDSEVIQSLGMRRAAFARWTAAREAQTEAAMNSSDLGGAFTATTKTFRLLLQSLMLGLGAWLVLYGELTPGAMIAGSILLGRALAPIELCVGQWPAVQRAQEGWSRLSALLTRVGPDVEVTPLPRPRALLEVQNLSVVPPAENTPVLRGVSFRLEPGQALGVIGPSGSGKSSLARAISGVWRPAGGTVRLDGATLDQYDPDVLGSYLGYLPQRVSLFDGTIAENIARMALEPDAAAVVKAAQRAGAHDMILQFPLGYDTRVSAIGGRLSGGQMQRIGLARAMYGDPEILILDEPNSNLDNDGSQALNHAIRGMKAAGKAVIIMAHRPAAIQETDVLLVLENGVRIGFGPRDDVLREIVRNHSEIARNAGPGGVS